MKIAMLYPNQPSFGIDTHDRIGIGGSESGFIRTAQHLVGLGHVVHVFNRSEMTVEYSPLLRWGPYETFKPSERYDVVYSLRHREPFHQKLNAGLKVLFLADTESHGLGQDVADGKIDLVMAVSHWQREKIGREENIPHINWYVTSNGVDRGDVTEASIYGQKVPGRCIFMGTPERGLGNLLTVWPEIKRQIPHASLHLYSSYLGWQMKATDNQEMMASYQDKLDELVKDYNVTYYGHTNAAGIRQAQLEAEVYLYPTNFYETCCMSVLEGMYCGVIPVATARAALMEKVVTRVTGFPVPAIGADSERYQELFIQQAVNALDMPNDQREDYQRNCHRYASRFTYDELVHGWVREWKRRL